MLPAAAGYAHVATVSFLASRAAPTAQFWLALAGGATVARASAVHGLRAGVGVSAAAILQTVAVMGPARVSGPLTQAMSAPLLGRMEARRAGALPEFAVALAIRLAHYAVLFAVFVWVILGGLDAFTGSYDALTRWLPFAPDGLGGALAVTIAGQIVWAVAFSAIQVAVYRRALRAWPGDGDGIPADTPTPPAFDFTPAPDAPGRHPTTYAALAVAATVALLAAPAWPVLAAVAAFLLVAWPLTRASSSPLKLGAALAGLLALSAASGSLLADLGVDEALRRASRAALLVLVATWLCAAARPAGLRRLFRAGLGRIRRVPGAVETRQLLEHLDAGPRIVAAGRTLPDRLRGVARRPVPVADAVIGWAAAESAAFERLGATAVTDTG